MDFSTCIQKNTEGFIDEFRGPVWLANQRTEQYNYLVNNWVKYDEYGEQVSELNETDKIRG